MLLEAWPELDGACGDESAISDAQALLSLRDSHINESLEKLREEKKIGQSLDAEIELRYPKNDPISTVLQKRADDLAEFFIVSKVTLVEDDNENHLVVLARHASGFRCPRSWRWVPELVSIEPWGEVSPRCAKVLSQKI